MSDLFDVANLFDLTGKTAVITGSTKGIGKAIAEAMAYQGAKVVISSRKEGACNKVASAIQQAGGSAVAIPCDVGKLEAIENLLSTARKAYGQIDILVCNAAVNPFFGSSEDIPDSAFQKVMDVNIKSNHWLAQRVAPEMKQRNDGTIIIISSIGGLKGSAHLGAYAISKAADMQLARNLAVELGPHNIRVNSVSPGLVKTDFARALWEDDDRRKAYESETPLRRLGIPEDLAGIAVYLASRAGQWTTGQNFVVDGGVTIR